MENTVEDIAEIEKKISNYIKGIKLHGSPPAKKETAIRIRSNELFQLNEEHPMDELAGVCINDIHYYDFKNVKYVNNTGIASLIDLSKCLMMRGVKVQFVNVSEKIKDKIRSMGLENILKCS